ncbi:MAG: hypothetical protein DRN05_06735 [Thermoplasmata archaeon]|nr:MAG: hypothetical protein DRN05_06735 [Thermoplasmata archaeon]
MGKLFILKKQGSQNLNSAALSLTTAFNKDWQFTEVRIHFSGAVTQTVTISVDDGSGSNYDTVLKTEDLSGETDFTWIPGEKVLLKEGDEIKVACTNSGSPAVIAYATIIGHEV